MWENIWVQEGKGNWRELHDLELVIISDQGDWVGQSMYHVWEIREIPTKLWLENLKGGTKMQLQLYNQPLL
jgi:hypothetical protein